MTRRAPIRPRLAADLLRAGHTVDFPLGGSSMRPLFAPGDILRIVPTRAADVHPGDIVVLDLDGKLLTHRLIHKTATHCITRGDDAPSCDPPLPHATLIGRVDVPPSPRAVLFSVRALFRV